MGIARLALFVLVSLAVVPAVPCQGASSAQLDAAEERLRAIYERGELRPRPWRAQWLPDGAGYVMPGRRMRVDATTGARRALSAEEREALNPDRRRSPDGKRVYLYRRGDLHVRELEGGRATRVTRASQPGLVRYGSVSWSPDGKRLAFVESDRSKVEVRRSLVPEDPTYPGIRETRFARVGGVIPALRVGVADAATGETRWLALEAPEAGFYLGTVAWAGNSEELLVEKLSRFRNVREFLLADVRTGELRTIFRETDPAWVVASYGVNSGLTWIRDGAAFVVVSEQDGWRHAYVYSRDGEKQALLTPGPFDIIERGVVDQVRGWFYYYASPEDATQKYLYRVRLDGEGAPVRVTPQDQPGTHAYEFAPNARYAFHTWSRFDTPPVTELVELPDHKVVRVLEKNERLRAKVAASHRPTEFLQVAIGDGITLDAWLMKPPAFDPKRKYPVLVYVYSEPHAQTVLDAWGASQADYHRLVADLGYLVLSLDSRGTPAPKGAAWRRAVFGSLGPLSTKEQAAALRALGRTRPYVDLTRVGIWGWSGGGSNTLNAMFREPDLYRVGIAVAAKPQPRLYNAWFQEIYMRTPAVNPEGYARSAPIRFAAGLKGDLLIIHGTGELNTHIQIVEGLVDRLIELGKRFDYTTYPNRRHGIREGRGTTVHLRSQMIRYLLDHLPAGPR